MQDENINNPVPPTSNSLNPEAPVQKNNKSARLRIIFGCLLAVTLLGSVSWLYYQQNQKVANLNSELATKQTEIEKLQATETEAVEPDAKDEVTPPAKTHELFPGQVDHQIDVNRILVTAVYKPSDPPESIWVEYGLTPDKLDKSTIKATKSLGMQANDNTYNFGSSLDIPPDSVTLGQSYFYRVAATYAGETVYSGTGSFTLKK